MQSDAAVMMVAAARGARVAWAAAALLARELDASRVTKVLARARHALRLVPHRVLCELPHRACRIVAATGFAVVGRERVPVDQGEGEPPPGVPAP